LAALFFASRLLWLTAAPHGAALISSLLWGSSLSWRSCSRLRSTEVGSEALNRRGRPPSRAKMKWVAPSLVHAPAPIKIAGTYAGITDFWLEWTSI